VHILRPQALARGQRGMTGRNVSPAQAHWRRFQARGRKPCLIEAHILRMNTVSAPCGIGAR